MEKFNLKWNDFSSNVTKSFQSLRKEEDFFDVTLVGDDFKHVTAHKLVLSSCSEYFKNIFANNKKYFQSNAMICLEGLNHHDLNNVLDYIYQGEVQILQHELENFLGVAERFKLEGLIGGSLLEDESKTENILKDDIPVTVKISKSENQLTDHVGIKEKTEVSVQSSDSDIQNLDDLNKKIEESYTKVSSGFYTCSYCEKSSKQRCHMREHVEVHLDLLFPCSLCDLPSRSRLKKCFEDSQKNETY